jgi:hypothetical protein
MRKRGPKSSAEISVVIPIGLDTRRPDPPAYLTAGQAKVWRSIVGSLPGGWVDAPQEPLLAAYCRHVESSRFLSAMVDKLDLKTCDLSLADRLLRMRERETRASAAVATKLRLTQQARMHPRTAGRAIERTPPAQRPWDRD